MSRLTTRTAKKAVVKDGEQNVTNIYEQNPIHHVAIQAVIDKLTDYEEAEEQGRLIILTCRPDDTVYNIIPDRNIISELVIRSVQIFKKGVFFEWVLVDGIHDNIFGFSETQLGKSVFLTRAEAESALREVQGSE